MSDTPAVTESLRERLMDTLSRHYGRSTHPDDLFDIIEIVGLILPILEAELQKHTEEKARLVGEFRRLAGVEGKATEDRFYLGMAQGFHYAWEQAAQMLEESKP